MPGRVFQRGDIYWIAFYSTGKESRTSAQTRKKREAEKLLAFYLDQVARGAFQGFEREQGLTFFEMLNDFLADYAQRGLRDMQIARYRSGHLRAFFTDIPVEEIPKPKIDLYIKHRL